MQPRILELRTKILKKNDELARALRSDFDRAGLFSTSLVSSPGSGKTELLTKTLAALHKTHRVAAIVGDLATDNDAVRLSASGAPARQILTGTMCHLEADMVRDALATWSLTDYDFLFIENVGNLVCPSSWDLGEALRVLLFSVTEGEDKPLKYPTLINTVDVVVISKIDLATAVEFKREQALANIQAVRPGVPVLEVSAKTGEGLTEWYNFLQSRRSAFLDAARRQPATSAAESADLIQDAAAVPPPSAAAISS
ncbi:MAG TPA: hydrogenase nickel incorporation protein HypB [Pirellulales bacterium]|jgi:hydrogenase nickel incorporation protein HypB|nr:hydrogenase nickel incorporation protein HypB [Pirellulales bacterium]